VYPEDSHWLMHRFSGWAPYFARIVAPAARARIAEHLFAGGYLDGVVVGEDLDQWAADALGLTALLTREQLAWWERIARHGYWSPEDGDDAGDALSPRVAPPPGPRPKAPIRSDTLRAGFYAGIAVGYAAGGHLDDAYRVVQMIGGPNPADQRRDVLAEVLTTIGPADIPGWIAQVHATVGLGARRGPLWAHLYHRLPELTDGQMWTILDRWLTEVPRTARTDVFGDLLLYRAAIARVAGRDECARLMTLIEDRECLNTSTG
jgi:hypothetical protein